eukprot:COSAG01_NODE_5534_length_4201_cov_48.592150_4_plen_151_part_00
MWLRACFTVPAMCSMCCCCCRCCCCCCCCCCFPLVEVERKIKMTTIPMVFWGGGGCRRTAVQKVLELVLLQAVHENGADFPALDRAQLRAVGAHITELTTQIRPDAVALTDALGFDDHVLKSTLGRHDGNVYEAICAPTSTSFCPPPPIY